MWLLTSRNRPAMCQEVLDAIERLQTGTPGVLWMDGCDYPNIRLPYGWSKVLGLTHLNIGEIMQRVFKSQPNEPWYGWCSDDCVPLSENFDSKLIEAAGSDKLAYPSDGWLNGTRDDGQDLPNITPFAVWGGDLLRKAGFWSPPGMIQMCIDEAWCRILHPIGRLKYVPEVQTEHRHFANGKREHDATDVRKFHGAEISEHDRKLCMALDYDALQKAVLQ